jgi:putative transcriptional regulator
VQPHGQVKSSGDRRPLFQRLRAGLDEGIGHARGELALRTTVLPGRPPEIGPADLTALRVGSEMSQAVFARLLNVSTRTVQSWEQGIRKPSQSALRLIQVFRQDPTSVLRAVGMIGTRAESIKKGRTSKGAAKRGGPSRASAKGWTE